VRASSSDSAIACPRSLVQIGTRQPPSESTEEARDWGHLVHGWAEHGRIEGRPGHVETFRRKLEATGVRRESLWPDAVGLHEVTFALRLDDAALEMYDDYTGALDRDKWKEAFDPTAWLTGTIDWLGRVAGAPWVDDLKTGRWPVDPAKSRQIRSYALVPWITAGRPLNWECHLSITQWPRYPLAGQPVRTWHTVDGFELMIHLEDLRWAMAHPGEVNPGGVCTFCQNRAESPYSGWMKSLKYSRLPTCWEGALNLIGDNHE
jgi:hypothetical protein